jgi:hypothetical protein
MRKKLPLWVEISLFILLASLLIFVSGGKVVLPVVYGIIGLTIVLFFLIVVYKRKIRRKRSGDLIANKMESVERCYNHPDSTAVGNCFQCGKYICEECGTMDEQDEETYCVSCMGKRYPYIG